MDRDHLLANMSAEKEIKMLMATRASSKEGSKENMEKHSKRKWDK